MVRKQRVADGWPVRRMPLRLVLIVPFVVQTVGAVWLTGWLAIRNGQHAVNEVAGQLRQETGDRISHTLDDFLETPHLVNRLSADAIRQGFIDPTDKRATYRYLRQLMIDFPTMESIFWGRPDGEFIGNGRFDQGFDRYMTAGPSEGGAIRFYDVDLAGNPNTLTNETPGFETITRPWYTAAVAAKQPTWSDVFVYHAYPLLALPASAPIYDAEGNLVGVVGSNFFMSQISEFLQSLTIGEHGQAFVVEPSGLLVASSTDEPLLWMEEGQPQRQRVQQSDNDLLRGTAAVLVQEFGHLSQIRQPTQLEFDLEGDRQFVEAIPYRDEWGLDWLIVVVVPESDFMAQINANTRVTIALCAGALLLSVASGIVTARWLAQPLVALNQATKEIAKGNLHQTVVTPRIREVDELSHSFNQMTMQLQSALTEQRDLNQALANSENQLRQFLDAVPVGIAIHDATGQLIYTNELAQLLLQIEVFQPVELENLAIAFQIYRAGTPDLYAQEHMPALRALNGEVLQTDDLELRLEKGTIPIEVSASPIFDQDDRIMYSVVAFQDISDRKRSQEQLVYNALHDTLTDLPNRNLLMERLELSINWARQIEDYHFAVLFLDLDRFKVINDSLGHLAGDELLVAIAHRLLGTIRPTDLAARLGGDEFVILLDEIGGIQDAVRAAERILRQFRTVFEVDGRELCLSTSIGIVLGDRSYHHPPDLLRDADIAMYRAKGNGRATYAIFDADMHTQALKRLDIEHDLRRAIRNQEFVVHYQPIVSLSSGKIIGFEALVRWQNPKRGLIPPGQFVAIAEETGLIQAIDTWVLRQACTQLAVWQQQFPQHPLLKISVNLSARDIWDAPLVETLDSILADTPLVNFGGLTLEITESILIENVSATIDLLSRIKERGIAVSIDDFGTGYSSMSYLHDLPIDTLKVDRSFVGHMTREGKNYRITETIVQLSNRLGLEAIAEGIETSEQLSFLQQFGCEYGQGYLFSKPIPAESATVLLQSATPYPMG
ncbi:MAG: EAL domain-containing protein [Kaiparowitsia implicata GSE-PSE-MK54-09C]|nr:EAL domain-containing protein [Kaiparowitsia implicata GSE-PSE-MK54-09C]